jgi:hypothetical protein
MVQIEMLLVLLLLIHLQVDGTTTATALDLALVGQLMGVDSLFKGGKEFSIG